MLELSDIINQMNLIDVYKTFHLNRKKNQKQQKKPKKPFLSASHVTLFKTDDVLGQKANGNCYEKIEITPCILFDNCTLKPDINNN